MSQVLRLIKMQ